MNRHLNRLKINLDELDKLMCQHNIIIKNLNNINIYYLVM